MLIFSLVFPIGATSSKNAVEVCANYLADISAFHSKEVGEKKLSGLIVESKDQNTFKLRNDTDNAITELWGVFKGTNVSFAPVMNANRSYSIYFADNAFSNENLSLVYSNIGDSSEPYHYDKKTKEPIDYKFQSSPIALMFPSSNSGMKGRLHIIISQSQAERKLKDLGITDINYDTLKMLLRKETEIVINGFSYECVIDNIYLDNFSHSFKVSDYDYYYASDVATVIGDFVFIILYANVPGVFPDELNRQSLYIMSEYAYRNKFYIEYAKELYSPSNFNYDYVRANLNDGFIPDVSILNCALNERKVNIWCVVLTIIVILVYVFELFIIYKLRLYKQPISMIVTFFISCLPFLIFKLIFSITRGTYLFSSYALTLYLIFLLILFLYTLLLNTIGRKLYRGNSSSVK